MESRARPNEEAVPSASSTPVSAEFAELYSAEIGHVLRSLRRLGVGLRDLEDVAHDVFLAAYRKFGDYDRGRPARAWLFGFSFRVAADHRRLARHKYEQGLTIDHADARPLADEQLADEQSRRLLLLALEDLEFERRGIFVMHELEGHVMPDIARTFGIPLNTAYTRLRLARRDFEDAVRKRAAMSLPTEQP